MSNIILFDLTEAIHTRYENFFEIGLKALNVSYKKDIIFCFKCNKTFNWRRSEAPERCLCGSHEWVEKGMFSRPDFLLIDENRNPYAMIRIDGPVHDRRAQRIFDRFQTQSFLNAGIKVFVIRNEHLFGAQFVHNKKTKKWVPVQLPDWHYTALVLMIVMTARNENTYKKYLEDKDVKFYLGI